ncbi:MULTISPECIES: phage protein NinX family protein [Rahnella]|uniref:DUF2591 family protein n=1 Tax=Rahnella laticis TaxID=2787622 RepID=A0ABS0DZ43_9GAMM|nr:MULTISPECIES: phage protein NinX family protein [Rahnella]MBF7978100.1 DUF2591 family protein [Rahnella laticis]MBF7998183.1 DUF2591 family protein [Rahnella sp. LAC-M12]
MKDYSAMSDFDVQQAVLQETWGKHPVRLLGKMMLDIMLSDYDPCNNPADAWPIIYGNLITIEPDYEFIDESEAEFFPTGLWIAERSGNHEFLQHVNESPLRAAMIVFLQMKDAEKCDG